MDLKETFPTFSPYLQGFGLDNRNLLKNGTNKEVMLLRGLMLVVF